jgi:hypothetical protein
MVMSMYHQGWLVLEDGTMVRLEEVKDYATFKDDGTLEGQAADASSTHAQGILVVKSFLPFWMKMM